MKSTIIIADAHQHSAEMRQLFQEYLEWANVQVLAEFGVQFGTAAELVESTMQHLDAFMPPKGRTWLGYVDGTLAGIVCLRELQPGVAEIKRMYVRPVARRQGLGRALIEQLLDESRHLGYRCVRLDSARFMREAHTLYRSAGFREIGEYEGSEIPEGFRKHWVFMEKELEPDPGQAERGSAKATGT